MAGYDRELLHTEVDKVRYMLSESDLDFLHRAIDKMDEDGLAVIDGRVVRLKPEAIVGMHERLLH